MARGDPELAVGRVVVLDIAFATHGWTYDVWGNVCHSRLRKRMIEQKRDGGVASVGGDTLQIECDDARGWLWGRLWGRRGIGRRALVVTTRSARTGVM